MNIKIGAIIKKLRTDNNTTQASSLVQREAIYRPTVHIKGVTHDTFAWQVV